MTSATQTSPSFPLVVPTKTAAPTARLLVRNEAGQVVQQWLVKNTKCTLGSSTSCALRCTLPGIAPFHALLVIGARQTFVRALAPQVTRSGNAVTEVLLSGSQNHFELAGHRFELERNPSTHKQTPEEQRRLKFALARPFSLQSRSQTTKAKEAAPSLPNTIAEQSPAEANESSQWVAKLVQSAIEPLECQIQNVLEPIAELRTQAEQQRELLRQYNEGTPVSPSETQEHDAHLDLSEFLKASDENIDSRLQEFASEQSVVLEVLGERLADVTNQLGAIERIVQNEENQEATAPPIAREQSAAFDELHDQVQKVAKSIQELENRHVSADADDAQWRDEICNQVGTLRESLTGLAQQTGESLREITRQTEESIGQLSDRTENSIQALSRQAEQGLEDLRDSNEENWNKLNSRTNSLFVKAEKLAAQTDALSNSTEQLSAQTGELTEQTSTLSEKTELLAEEAGHLSEKTDQLVSRTDNISTQTTEGFREVLERLESPTTTSESEAQWRQGVQEQFTQLRETLNNLASLPLAETAEPDRTGQRIVDEAESMIPNQESVSSQTITEQVERDSVIPPEDEIASDTGAEPVTYLLHGQTESSTEPETTSEATPEFDDSQEAYPSSYEGPITEKEFSPGDTTVTVEELNALTTGAVEERAESDSETFEYQQTESDASQSVELDSDFTADSLLSSARDVESDMQDAADLDFFATTTGNAWESSDGIVEPAELDSAPTITEDIAAATEQSEEDSATESSQEPEANASPESAEPETETQDAASDDNSWWQDGETEEEDFFGLGSDTTENSFQDKDFFAGSPNTTESWMEDAAPTELAPDFQLDEPADKITDAFEETSTNDQDEEFFGLGSVDNATQTDEPEEGSYAAANASIHEQDSTAHFETDENNLSSAAEYTDNHAGQATDNLEAEHNFETATDTEEGSSVAKQPTAESVDLPSWWTSDSPDDSFTEHGSDRIESFESPQETEESWTPPAFEPVDTSSVDSINTDSQSPVTHTDHFSDTAEEHPYEPESTSDSEYGAEVSAEEESTEDLNAEPAIAAEPEQEPLAASSTPSADTSSLENSDEESIEDYMKQLLARMRGEPAAEAPAPQEDSRPKEPSLAALKQDLQDEDEEDEIASAPAPSPENYTPRVLAPEKVQSLAAMRELANSSARTAIHKSSRQKNTRDVVLKGSISLIGFAVGMILIYLNGFAVNLVLVASVTSFAFALIWGVDAATTLLPLLQLDATSPAESEAEGETGDAPETGDGPESLSQSESEQLPN